MNSWQREEGWIDPPGVTWIPAQDAFNFVLYAKHATRVELLLYDPGDTTHPALIHEFDPRRNKSGPVWHCRVPRTHAPHATYYAYRVHGPAASPDNWHRFDGDKILLDPYARAIHFPPGFDRRAAIGPGPNDGRAPLGVLETDTPFDWGDDRPLRHGSDLVIYEMHVRGFTRHPDSGVPAARRGTFAGVVDKIPYLRELGVTAVELMPVFQYDPQEGNYWGYMPLNFMAPHAAYSMHDDAAAQRNEFRAMVRSLHEAGIEVLLDVVYNHTCEGDDTWPTYSYRGIDNSEYYIRSDDPEHPYADFTGCRNTLDASSVAVRKLITDSLASWREDMHVDGFRFDLASIFARRSDGSIDEDNPPIFAQIACRADILNARLIAEPWDAIGTHQLGRAFPGWLWMQWNGKYRETLQQFACGAAGMITELMTRLHGSTDLFPDALPDACRPWQSVNYVTSHDGSTLYDLVSYEQKRNLANGHDNTDGPYEFRWNCGHEGDEQVPAAVDRLRRRQARNLFCLLLLSNGAPMFRMGDEFLHTQGGNTNPYNQDNETTWLDWRRLETNRDMFRFVQGMIAFRKRHPSIGRSHFWHEDVSWHGAALASAPDDALPTLAFHLRGGRLEDDDLYVMINGGDDEATFTVPSRGPWRRVVDTSADSPRDFHGPDDEEPLSAAGVAVSPRSVQVLVGPGSVPAAS